VEKLLKNPGSAIGGKGEKGEKNARGSIQKNW